jgi:hypothetical protein
MAWTEKIGPHSWRVRYPTADGRIGSCSGFGTKKIANDYANQIEADQRRGTWLDPQAAKTSVSAWAALWADTLDVEIRTEENYLSRIRNHIEPRWTSTALGDITALAVTLWIKQLRRHYARSTRGRHRHRVLDDARRRRRQAAHRRQSGAPAGKVRPTPRAVTRSFRTYLGDSGAGRPDRGQLRVAWQPLLRAACCDRGLDWCPLGVS